MKIVLLGPVGSGKGTMANLISKKYNIPHISTGAIFRENIAQNTPLGIEANKYISRGKLVPESITNNLVKNRIAQEDCKNGFILDGYPRNIEQVYALDSMTKVDIAILIDLSEDIIIKRLSTRRMCLKCKQPTSLDVLINDRCEKCGGEVYIREDDKPEVIKTRLVTNAVSPQVIDFYKNKGLFGSIDANNTIENNFKNIVKLLNKKGLK